MNKKYFLLALILLIAFVAGMSLIASHVYLKMKFSNELLAKDSVISIRDEQVSLQHKEIERLNGVIKVKDSLMNVQQYYLIQMSYQHEDDDALMEEEQQ